MDDKLKQLQALKDKFEKEENIKNKSLKKGDIIYVPLTEDEGLTLKGGFRSRKKYIVIVGFTKEGNAIGALLINSNIPRFKSSQKFLDNHYILKHENYQDILDYTCWLDCTDLFELNIEILKSRNALLKGALNEEDKQNVMVILENSEFIDNITKLRFGIKGNSNI